jgi:hypothetical protein
MKAFLFAIVVALCVPSVSSAQYYPQLSQLRQAPFRSQPRSNYGVFVQRGNSGYFFQGNNRRPSFQTYQQGRFTHVIQGNRRVGTIYRR